MNHWDKFQKEQADWANPLFGEPKNPIPTLKLAIFKTSEIIEAPGSLPAFAQAMNLLIHAAYQSGFTVSQLQQACQDSFHAEKKKVWDNPFKDEAVFGSPESKTPTFDKSKVGQLILTAKEFNKMHGLKPEGEKQKMTAAEFLKKYKGDPRSKGKGKNLFPEQKKVQNAHQHTVSKKRWIGGRHIFLRSIAEANWARYLDYLKKKGAILDWKHEPRKFLFPQKTGNNHYTPDFHVTLPDGTKIWHEVKGWMSPESQVKIKRFKKYFPEEKLRIVMDTEVKAIGRAMGSIIGDWEYKSNK